MSETTKDLCAKCGAARNHPYHDSARWPGRLTTGHPYHGFVARADLTLDDLSSYRPAPTPEASAAREEPEMLTTAFGPDADAERELDATYFQPCGECDGAGCAACLGSGHARMVEKYPATPLGSDARSSDEPEYYPMPPKKRYVIEGTMREASGSAAREEPHCPQVLQSKHCRHATGHAGLHSAFVPGGEVKWAAPNQCDECAQYFSSHADDCSRFRPPMPKAEAIITIPAAPPRERRTERDDDRGAVQMSYTPAERPEEGGR